jgi:hypothetical protein
MNGFRMLSRLGLGALAVTLAVGTATALAGSGVGGVFNLGETNTVSATSILTGATAGSQLKVVNNSADAAATALDLSVVSGRAPFKVNSSSKVTNLNADLLDSRDSTYFLPKTGTAANSSKLGGLAPTAFWKTSGNAGTAPGTNFLGTTDHQALELKVNGQRALRLEPAENQDFVINPNIVGGFPGNSVDPGQSGSVIAGGGIFVWAESGNHVSGSFDVIGGGADNTAGGYFSTVTGGHGNTAGGWASTVAGGLGNTASNNSDTVAGGQGNTASGTSSTVAGGYSNKASGGASTVPGGSDNTAGGDYSFAAGLRAKATQPGSFVWGDNTITDLTSPAANTFTVRASGGIWLGTTSSPSIPAGRFINTSTGGYLSTAGIWTNASDRALKHDFRPLNRRSVLEKVARMPITSWSYKAESPSLRHIGPMAQDFYKAFGLGQDDKHIGTVDEGGVALAAIQGLYRENQALKRQNKALNLRLTRLEHLVGRLSRR